jgi:hypothetical protein
MLLIVFFNSALPLNSASAQHSSESVKRGFSVLGVWGYQGGEEKSMEIRFLRDHKAVFKGGYEFYSPAKWYFNPTTAELRLLVSKMKEHDFKLFDQWTYTGLKTNPKEKTISYRLHQARICFMGYFFEKQEK